MSSVHAEWEKKLYNEAKKERADKQEKINEIKYEINKLQNDVNKIENKQQEAESQGGNIAIENIQAQIDTKKSKLNDTEWEFNKLKNEEKLAKNKYDDSSESHNDISSRGFEIRTGDLFPWAKPADKWSVTANTNFYLSKIIQMLMILLGSASLLIMTVWAGYMIMYHGQDELLSKGKSIFTAGIIALVVAGSSYYLVSAMRFLLFQ